MLTLIVTMALPFASCAKSNDASRCVPVSDIGQAIAIGLTSTGKGGSLRDAQAVRSGDFNSVWFVAAEIDGPDGTGGIGVWATISVNLADTVGSIYAVNDIANEFTGGKLGWPDGRTVKSALSMSDDGAHVAENCVRSIQAVGE